MSELELCWLSKFALAQTATVLTTDRTSACSPPLAHINYMYWNEASCLFLPVHWRRGIRFRDSSFHQKQPSAVCWEAAIVQGRS